jgi:hypothetical protein
VQLIPIPTNGLWTVNFAVTTPYNSSPNILYIGHGVLGNNTYWNGLSGGLFAYTPPSLLDDGVTPSTVNLGATNYGNGSWYGAGNLLLLDQFCYFGTTGTSFVFSNVPMGRYNLAAYLCDGPYSGRGTTITINGVSQSVTNKQDVLFMPGDNTVIYTNIVVTGGTLEMHLQPVAATSSYDPNNEGDFNGAQLQFTGPYITRITQNGTNFTLTWVGGGLIQATNVLGPWVTNTAVSPYTNPATGAMRFFRVLYQ